VIRLSARTDRDVVWDVDSGRHTRKRVLDGGAHWRHVANTFEPSMCGGDAALCQVTLAACYLTGRAVFPSCSMRGPGRPKRELLKTVEQFYRSERVAFD